MSVTFTVWCRRCPCLPSRTGASSSATSLCALRRSCVSRRRRRCATEGHATDCIACKVGMPEALLVARAWAHLLVQRFYSTLQEC